MRTYALVLDPSIPLPHPTTTTAIAPAWVHYLFFRTTGRVQGHSVHVPNLLISLDFWKQRKKQPFLLLHLTGTWGNETCIMGPCFPMKCSSVLQWPFWWFPHFDRFFWVSDLPLKSNDIPGGFLNEVHEWPLILNQWDYSEWVVCVCRVRLWVFPTTSLHILNRRDLKSFWEISCRMENG